MKSSRLVEKVIDRTGDLPAMPKVVSEVLRLTDDPMIFTSRGTSRPGYAYLTNRGETAFYRVGPLISGMIRIQRYDGTSKWE